MTKKGSKAITIIKIIVFVLVLSILLSVANSVLMKKDNINKYQSFYDEKDPYDILFFGSSRVLDAFQPMELWEDFGIRSHNMAQHAEGLAMNYWQLMNALEVNKPQLVVMDISMFYSEGVDITDESSRAYFHKQIDHMPLSITKIKTIRANVPKELYGEYIFPFVLYHSRWNFVNWSDFKKSKDVRMGAEVRTNIMAQERNPWDNDSLAEVFIPENVNLDKIVELCKQQNVDLLFICMPCNENYSVNPTLNCFEKYFDDNGVNYINISRDEDFMNYDCDFADTSHVNVAGSHKLTTYIGEFFEANYKNVVVNESVKNEWNEALVAYNDEKDRMIQSFADNPIYIMNLTYSDNNYEVRIVGNTDLFNKYGVSIYYPDAISDEGYDYIELTVYHKNEEEPFLSVKKSE